MSTHKKHATQETTEVWVEAIDIETDIGDNIKTLLKIAKDNDGMQPIYVRVIDWAILFSNAQIDDMTVEDFLKED